MLVQVRLVVKQESGYIAQTPRGYIVILGETLAKEDDLITIALPEYYKAHEKRTEAQNAFHQAMLACAKLHAYPYTTEIDN